jgi:5-hydroxyisourate hydrolase
MTEGADRSTKPSRVSTHVLDTAAGRPAAGVAVRFQREQDGAWTTVGAGRTDEDGRLRNWSMGVEVTPTRDLTERGTPLPDRQWDGPEAGGRGFEVGRYRLVFDVQHYFLGWGLAPFFPEVIVEFLIDGSGHDYHVPLLVSPYSYTTYRGS